MGSGLRRGYIAPEGVTVGTGLNLGPSNLTAGLYYNPVDYGGDPTNNRDSTAAVQSAINAAAANGGTIILPGIFSCASQLTIGGNGVTFLGLGGGGSGTHVVSGLSYTGTAANFISQTVALSATTFIGCFIGYTNAGFAGTLISLTNAGVSSFLTFDRCLLGGSGVAGAAFLLDIDNYIDVLINGCNFAGAVSAIRLANAVLTNNCTIRNCNLTNLSGTSLLWTQPVQQLSLLGNVFEQTAGTNKANAIVGTGSSFAVTLLGNWFGDTTALAAQTWITLGGVGLSISGNYISGVGNTPTSLTGIKFNSPSSGAVIGNSIPLGTGAGNIGIDYNSIAHTDLLVAFNSYGGTPTPTANQGNVVNSVLYSAKVASDGVAASGFAGLRASSNLTTASLTTDETKATAVLKCTAAAAIDAGASLGFVNNTGNATPVYPSAAIHAAKESAAADGNYNSYLRFFTATSGGGFAERSRFDGKGNVIVNTAALATTATDGFLYIPTCPGAPTGVPTTYTGRVPMVYDTTNHKFWIYDQPAGAWKGVVLA